MNTPHRLEQIVDGLVSTFDVLKDDTATSGFPIQVHLVLKTYHHWSALQEQARRFSKPVFPTLMLNFGTGGSRIPGGSQAEYASLGETEDGQPFTLIGLVKKQERSTDVTTDNTDEISDQVSNLVYSVERLINGTNDLGVEGVEGVNIVAPPETSEGRATAIAGVPLDVVVFRIVVTHIYRSTNFE